MVLSNSSATDTMILEAVTGSGVVLGSVTTSFKVVGGDSNTRGTASAKMVGLSDDEIRRVTLVRAKWKY